MRRRGRHASDGARPLPRRHLLRPARPAAGQRAHRADRRGPALRDRHAAAALGQCRAGRRRASANFGAISARRPGPGSTGADPGAGGRRRPARSRERVEAVDPAKRCARRATRERWSPTSRDCASGSSASTATSDPWNLKQPAAAWSRPSSSPSSCSCATRPTQPESCAHEHARGHRARRRRPACSPPADASALLDALHLWQQSRRCCACPSRTSFDPETARRRARAARWSARGRRWTTSPRSKPHSHACARGAAPLCAADVAEPAEPRAAGDVTDAGREPMTEETTDERLAAGDQAPDFDLPADGGGRITLADARGQAARALLLSQGRHAGLHQGGHRLRRHAAELRRRPASR